MGLALLLSIGILLLRTKSEVLVHIAIIDSCGEQIWPLIEKDASKIHTDHKAIKTNQGYAFEITDVAYLSYLQNFNATYIRVWEKGNDSIFVDYPIDNYLNIPRQEKVKKNPNRPKEYAFEMHKMGKKLKAQKGTFPTGRDNLRKQQKGSNYNVDQVYLAHKHVKKMIKEHKDAAQLRDAGIRKWISLGPGNVGGRVRTIAPHPTNPNVILIGSISGGIWRSTNGGSAWTNVSDFLPNMAVSSIVYNPLNPNIVYAATGETFPIASSGNAFTGIGATSPGIGVLKSFDGGISWTLLPQPPLHKWIGALAVDPNNPDHIFIGVANTNANNLLLGDQTGRIIKSIDGGNSWDYSPSIISSIPLDIDIRPENSNQVYVGCANHAYRSSNGAQSGSNVAFVSMVGDIDELPENSGRIEISLAPNSQNKLYASITKNNGEVWWSLDNGVTWSKRSDSDFNYLNNLGWYAHTIWTDPVNSNRVIVGGLDLWRSNDGGSSFVRISDKNDDSHILDTDEDGNIGNSIHADQHRIVAVSNYSVSNRKVFIANDGGIYSTNNIATVTENNGWIDLNNNLQITQFYGGAVSKDRSFIIGGAQDNAFISNNSGGGSNWDLLTTGDGAFAAINPEDKNIAYANINNNLLLKTIDGGDEWTTIARFGGTDLAFCADFSEGCVTFFPTKFEVQDNSPLVGKFVMDKNDPNILYVGADRLWKNDNAGDAWAWSLINDTSVSPGSYVTIETGSTSNIIWTGTNNGIVQKTNNGGTNWSSVVLPSAIFARYTTDIAISPFSDNKVVVTEGTYVNDNIWLTNNGGTDWTNISLGFDMQVNTITWHPTKDGWLYVGTDFGLFASENNGNDWSIMPVEDENEGPFNGEVSELFWSGDGSSEYPYYLYASTFGRGMWRTKAPLRDKIYVDRLYTGGDSNGSFEKPYITAYDGFESAGSGSEVIFLSSGIHNANSNSIILDRKVTISLQNGGASVIIK